MGVVLDKAQGGPGPPLLWNQDEELKQECECGLGSGKYSDFGTDVLHCFFAVKWTAIC